MKSGDMLNGIFFSIIIPTYNREKFIGKTIESLLNQTYKNFEIIVIDDGSKDETYKVINDLPDKRVRYFKVENGERGRARNIGTLKATGDYITFIDSDDLAYPNHFEVALQLITENRRPPCIHLAYEMKDTSGNLVTRFLHPDTNLNYQLLKGNLFSCIGVFLRKDIALQYLFQEERALAGTEDWLLWLKLAARFPFIGSNTITACMINHDSRSVLHFNKGQMLDRTRLLVHFLKSDPQFITAFGASSISKIEAHMYTYMALHSVLSKNNREAFGLLLMGVKLNKSELLKRRTLAILKYLILNTLS